MKAAHWVVLGIALASGGVAAMLASKMNEPAPLPSQPVAAAPQIDTVDILVAKGDIGIGNVVNAENTQWQAWPKAAVADQYIKKAPGTMENVAGSISRASFSNGEPIRESKLIKANGSGYMAALLPSGMRAISAEITPETGVGGFVLPNDRVDVILTRQQKAPGSNAEFFTSETILSNVRVLAIDQTVEEQGKQKVVTGKIATLELRPEDAETLALARRLGSLSLVLRSLAETDPGNLTRRESVNVVRFGLSTSSMR
jgi:pilus assembly protein CpaB